MKDLTQPRGGEDVVLLRALMDQMPDWVYFKDQEGRFLKVGGKFAERLRLKDPSHAVGKSDHDFFSPAHAARSREEELQIMRSGLPMVGRSHRGAWRDGSESWMVTTKMPLRDETGRILGTIGVSRELNDRAETGRREAELRRANSAFERDLEQAWAILRTLLPEQPPEHPRLRSRLFYRPMLSIGGDYISFHGFDRESPGVFLADLMGHGTAAALHLTLLKFLSDSLLGTFGTDPKALLEHLNRQVRRQLASTFVAGAYGVFRFRPGLREGTLTIAGAGHHGPVVQRGGTGQTELMPLPAGGALGIFDTFATYNVTLPVAPGDRIFLFTDGLTDTFNPSRRILGMGALLPLFARTRKLSLESAVEAVLAGVETFRAGAAINDDVVLAGFEVV